MHSTTFASLGLGEALVSAVAAAGYEAPTPIQVAAIPPLLEGRDLLATAQTGTGKTAAFALPIIAHFSSKPGRPAPRQVRALILAPTRELAAQIDASIEIYARGSRVSHTCIFGGVGKSPQAKALGRGVDILVATPGRLLDLHGDGSLRLDLLEIVVLDEADRMLDMGFIHDVRKVFALIPERRHTMLFSATMPKEIATLAAKILKDPARVAVTPEKPAVELIEQSVAFVEKADKRAFLVSLVAAEGVEKGLVFTRTKHGADRLAKAFHAAGIPAAAIHANKSQGNRTRTLEDFRSGAIRILVATDLAARGIDVEAISHVYNYELPDVAETYVHRIGRTARAGASGRAIALCDTEEKPLLRAIEKLLRKDVPLAAGPEIAAAYEAARLDRIAKPDQREAERRDDESRVRVFGRGGRRGPERSGGRPSESSRAPRPTVTREGSPLRARPQGGMPSSGGNAGRRIAAQGLHGRQEPSAQKLRGAPMRPEAGRRERPNLRPE